MIALRKGVCLRRTCLKLLGLILCGLAYAACPAAGYAQETDETISINSAVVSLEVLVTDKKTGERIDGLKREDFEVTDDGRTQAISFFGQGADAQKPLALVLLTDLNFDSMPKAQVRRLRGALRRAMWSSLQTRDQVAVVTIYPDFKIVNPLGYDRQTVLESLAPTTESREAIEQPVQIKQGDIAASLLATIRYIQERRQQFRLEFVVISERPYGPLQQAARSSMEQLLASGAVVNEIRKAKGKEDVLDHICEETGGEVVNIRGTDYSEALERVIENLARRYSIGFTSDRNLPDGSFHKLGITIRVPNASGSRRALEVRARRGYVAGSSTSRIE
jgi:VWFA-related protein